LDNLIKVMEIAIENKPAFGAKCNHCGYCCLTEICVIGQEFSGKTLGPCPYLVGENPNLNNYNPNKHYCSIAIHTPEMKKEIGAGVGCCAETTAESLARITANHQHRGRS